MSKFDSQTRQHENSHQTTSEPLLSVTVRIWSSSDWHILKFLLLPSAHSFSFCQSLLGNPAVSREYLCHEHQTTDSVISEYLVRECSHPVLARIPDEISRKKLCRDTNIYAFGVQSIMYPEVGRAINSIEPSNVSWENTIKFEGHRSFITTLQISRSWLHHVLFFRQIFNHLSAQNDISPMKAAHVVWNLLHYLRSVCQTLSYSNPAGILYQTQTAYIRMSGVIFPSSPQCATNQHSSDHLQRRHSINTEGTKVGSIYYRSGSRRHLNIGWTRKLSSEFLNRTYTKKGE